MTSLEGWDSAIELRPRTARGYPRLTGMAAPVAVLWPLKSAPVPWDRSFSRTVGLARLFVAVAQRGRHLRRDGGIPRA
jgi:hypothetical protein